MTRRILFRFDPATDKFLTYPADPEFGQQILEACIAELSTQLRQAMVEKTPLEEMPPTLP